VATNQEKRRKRMEEVLEMSSKELQRYKVLSGVMTRALTQVKAAEILGITDRQIRNLLFAVKNKGAQGLVSQKRKRPSNHRKPAAFKHEVLSIVRERYNDFGPSLVREKLETLHDLNVSTETLRNWMTGAHIWIPKQRRIRTHPPRKRRECFGEMIQVDGSHEFWFEERGERCVVIVFVDDSTGKITSLYFSKGESLEAYFRALEKHLIRYGRPLSIYSDRFAVFDSKVEGNLTQFKRALKALGINSLLANSPQAKGRVERVNRTLQDRLIKEMRLLKINTLDAANEYADKFVEFYNEKFSREPASSFDSHRPLETGVDLSRILSRYEERTLTKDGVFQFHNRFYKIVEPKNMMFRGKKVEVRVGKTGLVRIFIKDVELKAASLDSIRDEAAAKEPFVNVQWKEKRVWSPPLSHPWKTEGYRRRRYDLLQKVV
jgi:transposase InsO family protein